MLFGCRVAHPGCAAADVLPLALVVSHQLLLGSSAGWSAGITSPRSTRSLSTSGVPGRPDLAPPRRKCSRTAQRMGVARLQHQSDAPFPVLLLDPPHPHHLLPPISTHPHINHVWYSSLYTHQGAHGNMKCSIGMVTIIIAPLVTACISQMGPWAV